MRCILFSPFANGPLRGNMITVQRIAHHLPSAGCETITLALDTTSPGQAQQIIDQYRPELLHAFHAFHSGPATRMLAAHNRLPYLITMTGSDLYDPAFSSDPNTALALRDATAITCFDPLAASQLTAHYPELTPRVQVIPQGVTPLALHEPFLRPADSFIVLLPAAIRPVKGILEAMDALAPLAAQVPRLRLWLAGGDLDPAYAAQVREQAAQLPWITLLGEVPHQRMGDLFAASDIILNSSHFEGGMANSLLEAMAAGKPVIASDVAGNRSLVRHGETGWLFHDHHHLRWLVQRAMDEPALLQTMGEAAGTLVAACFSPHKEAEKLYALYIALTK